MFAPKKSSATLTTKFGKLYITGHVKNTVKLAAKKSTENTSTLASSTQIITSGIS